MGLIQSILGTLFGGRNVIKDTAEIFTVNKEADAIRVADYKSAALAQLGAEFAIERKGLFDRFMDGLNRLPRPAMALGTLALVASAMIDPVWFASRMQGLALVPDPLWWLMGAIVSFYFGSRFQAKTQDFQASIGKTLARTSQVVDNIEALEELRPDSPGVADVGNDADLQLQIVAPAPAQEPQSEAQGVAKPKDGATYRKTGNAALDAWQATR